MGLFDSASDFFSGGGAGDASAGYDQANAFLSPYREGGAQDYQKYRQYASQFGQQLQPYSGAGSWMYNQINQSPVDYYNEIMKGYSESPQAQYEQQQALKGSSAGASASGMLGSGAFQKGLQQNAADISNRDQQRYYGNVMGANQAQMGYLGNLQNQQSQYNQMQQYLSGLGYNSAGTSGQNSINQGLSNAYYDQNAFDSVAGLVGMGGQNFKNNWMANNPGDGSEGANLPYYMMFM